MKRNLVVTLADKNYIDQAKQLFSSVYFNAGWNGDYLLLAHELPEKELEWFRDKGILVRKCKPMYNKQLKWGFAPTLLSKFYLFTEDMKKWQNIVYLDADIIVKASLDDLTKVKGFAAVLDGLPKLFLQLQKPNSKEISRELYCLETEGYDLRSPAFNAGVMAFSTDIIEKDTFLKLKGLFVKYGKKSYFGDQGTLNLFFSQKWKKLPVIYNILLSYLPRRARYRSIDRTVILHFASGNTDPFKASLRSTKHQFYRELKYNLDRADRIDLTQIPKRKKWSRIKIFIYSLYFELEYTLSRVRIMGKIGLVLKKTKPKSLQ